MIIGIYTFHYVHNYGAMLQGYALKTFLESQGHRVVMMDRRHSHLTKWSPRPLNDVSVRSILLYLKYLLKWYLPFFLPVYLRERRFESFLLKYLNRERVTTETIIDVAIFGSDQIWSKFKTGYDRVFWGTTISGIKKVSYAASMGILEIERDDIPFVRSALSNFSAISVREYNLKTTLERFQLAPHVRIEVVVDPVFLLPRNEWSRVMARRLVRENYLLFYDFQVDKDTTCMVKRIAEEKGLIIVRLTNGIEAEEENMLCFKSAGPREFLSLVFYADFVVSSSFHGTAFSVIFEKQFLARQIWNKDRVKQLLDSLDLSSRFIDSPINVDLTKSIDYIRVREILEPKVIMSEAFLDTAIHA